MEMTCEILHPVDGLKGVVQVLVPGIYPRGEPMPERMAKLVRKAALSLQDVYKDVVKAGGHLYLSDCFRTAADQHKAHLDYLSGRKKSYSPDTCSSVHEAARAIDIDAFDTGIGHARVRAILNEHGWSNITDSLTDSECWHYEFRGERWQAYRDEHDAGAMAHGMKEEIGNVLGAAEAAERGGDVKWLQKALNTVLRLHLAVDGIYGPKTKDAVSSFQKAHGLQIDGVAGPITRARLKEVLGTN
jgi:Putative peptidoglycan binding domain